MENLYNLIIDIINKMDTIGLLANCFLIIFESIIPPLPLGLFITVLFVNYGTLLGFFLSWILTIIGCVIAYFIFKNIFEKFIDKRLKKHKKLKKYITIVSNIKLYNLVFILSIPSTPAFLVNIAAGLSNMPFKKFLLAIIIGKIPLVLFWGLIGTGLLETLRNPKALLGVIILVSISYIFSRGINKKLDL